MNFKNLSEEDKRQAAELMFQKLSSPQELKDWIMFYFGLEYPNTTTDRANNSNPLDAIWQVYNAYLKNDGETPGVIWMSSREGMKTISVAILEIILVLHFQLEIAHASAVESQSQVCLRYIDNFLIKIEPLMEAAGWVRTTQNKRTFEFSTPEGKAPFIKVVVCTPKGMNSLHANLLCVDELDLADPSALNEGRNIVGYSRGIHGLTLFLSTRKYATGNMAEVVEKKDEMGYSLLKWNIIDVTERCGPERHLPDLPKQDRYVHQELPLRQISVEEYEGIPAVEKPKWDLIKNAHAGCATCPLLPICRTKLSQLPPEATGGFYKPIKAVIQKFRENPPDIAEAQLLCWKPGSQGLVFSRFNPNKTGGNVISLKEAYEAIDGPTRKPINELTLLKLLKDLEIPIYAGVDWGFTHDSVIIVMAKLPNDEILILDTFAEPGLEFSDVLATAITFRDKYGITKWFCDQAMPSHIKSFNKNAMKSPVFTKDVVGGIEAIRSKILTSSGRRLLKILDTPSNQKTIVAFRKHRFLLDGQGNPTRNPDDEPGIADICDAARYVGQNLFPVKGPQKPIVAWSEGQAPKPKNPTQENQMREEISKRIGPSDTVVTTGKRGGFHFSF